MNEEINDGGPAFPQTIDDAGTLRAKTQGMTLRDYFAAKSLQGLVSDWGALRSEDCARVAMFSYRISDAMLAQREVRP